MPGFGTSQLEFPLKVSKRHVEIAHRHLWRCVAEQFHHGRKADTGSKHLRGIAMPKLVRDDAGGKAQRVADLMQVIAELTNECLFGARTCQEPLSAKSITSASQGLQKLRIGSRSRSAASSRAPPSSAQ